MIEPTSDARAALERYAQKWIAQGFRLVIQPRGSELPAFMRSYRPDAVLMTPTPSASANIAVEVLYKGQTDAPRRIEALQHLLSGHDDWRLEILYAGVLPPNLQPTSPDRLRDALDRIEAADDHDPGAFLLLWPVLEATARILLPSATRRPQSPGRVVELLAGDGYVVPSDADILVRSADLRNRLMHGDFEAEVPPELRRETERIARELVTALGTSQLATL